MTNQCTDPNCILCHGDGVLRVRVGTDFGKQFDEWSKGLPNKPTGSNMDRPVTRKVREMK